MAFALAVPAIASTIVSGIVSLFQGKDQAIQIDDQFKLQMQIATEQALTAHEATLASAAKGQSDQNIELAKTGELGWRAWLGEGLTIAFLALIYTIVLGVFGTIAGSFIGVNTAAISLAVASVPQTLVEFLWGALTFLLGGLYQMRANEKLNLVKAAQSFNTDLFFKEYRRLSGGTLNQEEVSNLQSAINRATSNQ